MLPVVIVIPPHGHVHQITFRPLFDVDVLPIRDAVVSIRRTLARDRGDPDCVVSDGIDPGPVGPTAREVCHVLSSVSHIHNLST